MFDGTKLTLSSEVNQDLHMESDKTTRKHNMQESQEVSPFPAGGH